MKKSLLALAALAAFAGTAFAESSVTVYGTVDVGIVYEDNSFTSTPVGESTFKVSSGVLGGSRLGFRGVEDLGGGMKGRFQIETGFCADSAADEGVSDGGSGTVNDDTCGGDGKLFGRTAIVGLDGGFGSVQLGRQYAPVYIHQESVDPFGNGLAGQIQNLFPIMQRLNNSVAYSTPAMGGLAASLAYGAGEVAGKTSTNRVIDGSVSYTAGPLYVGFAYVQRNDIRLDGALNPGGEATAGNLGATYDFGMAKGHLMYQKSEDEDVNGVKGNEFDTVLIGASVPLGQGNLMASYIQHDDKLNTAPNDAHQTAIGYTYALSKRTQLYTAFAKISNKNLSMETVGNATDVGSGDKAFNFGVAHNF